MEAHRPLWAACRPCMLLIHSLQCLQCHSPSLPRSSCPSHTHTHTHNHGAVPKWSQLWWCWVLCGEAQKNNSSQKKTVASAACRGPACSCCSLLSSAVSVLPARPLSVSQVRFVVTRQEEKKIRCCFCNMSRKKRAKLAVVGLCGVERSTLWHPRHVSSLKVLESGLIQCRLMRWTPPAHQVSLTSDLPEGETGRSAPGGFTWVLSAAAWDRRARAGLPGACGWCGEGGEGPADHWPQWSNTHHRPQWPVSNWTVWF